MTRFKREISALQFAARRPAIRLAISAVAVAALACLVAGLFWWAPAKREHAELAGLIESRRREAVDAALATDLARAAERAGAGIALFEKKLDAGINQSQLVQNISGLAARDGVRVVNQSFDEGKTHDGVVTFYIDLSVEDSYEALRDFIGELARLEAWVEVQDARIERAREGAGAVKAQLRLVSYRQIEAAPAATGSRRS